MKLTISHLLFHIYIVFEFLRVVGSTSFLYEKLNDYGRGRKIIPNFRRFRMPGEAYPDPLPSSTRGPLDLVPSPYRSIYQGRRRLNDTRVYRKRFEYPPAARGHHIFCQGMFDCVITHLAVETEGGIPILLRGGAGYHFFVVIAKAKPGDELKGMVRAFCIKDPEEPKYG